MRPPSTDGDEFDKSRRGNSLNDETNLIHMRIEQNTRSLWVTHLRAKDTANPIWINGPSFFQSGSKDWFHFKFMSGNSIGLCQVFKKLDSFLAHAAIIQSLVPKLVNAVSKIAFSDYRLSTEDCQQLSQQTILETSRSYDFCWSIFLWSDSKV